MYSLIASSNGSPPAERAEPHPFMEDYDAADSLDVLSRRFAYPDYDIVRYIPVSDPREISVAELFSQLGLGEDSLKEVYEYANLNEVEAITGLERFVARLSWNKRMGFTGRFTERGKRSLANILNKEITFFERPSSDPVGVNPQTFLPTE